MNNTNHDPDLDTLVSALLYLMSRYCMKRCPSVARAIGDHLAMIEHHPDNSEGVLHTTAKRLKQTWTALEQARPGGNRHASASPQPKTALH